MSEEHPTMREDEEVELLSEVDLFESLSEEEIRILVRQNSDVRLGEGETFYAPWEHDGKLFIGITSGSWTGSVYATATPSIVASS